MEIAKAEAEAAVQVAMDAISQKQTAGQLNLLHLHPLHLFTLHLLLIPSNKEKLEVAKTREEEGNKHFVYNNYLLPSHFILRSFTPSPFALRPSPFTFISAYPSS